MGILKKILANDNDVFSNDVSGNEYYEFSPEEALNESEGFSKMILFRRYTLMSE